MNPTKCPECGGKLARKGYAHVTKLAGFTVTDGTGHVLCCAECGTPLLSSAELAGYERRAAQQILATAGKPVSGAVLKFARKALGLKQKELAALLDSNEQQVSRWENEDEIDRRLRLAVAGLLALAEGGVGIEAVGTAPGHKLEIRRAG
jgi:DNA-binding XRE family transcriptional regulator